MTANNENAYALLAAFQKTARLQGRSQAEINLVLDDARSRDYYHLLVTIRKNTR